MHKMSDKLIDDLGGPTAVARMIRLKPHQVTMMRDRGIPWRWRPYLHSIAAGRGITVHSDFLNPWKGHVASANRDTVSAVG